MKGMNRGRERKRRMNQGGKEIKEKGAKTEREEEGNEVADIEKVGKERRGRREGSE